MNGHQLETEIAVGYETARAIDMLFQWQITDGRLHCKLTAPTEGWVAVGFNPQKGLAGTNLIMGCVENGILTLEDRFIVKPGLHKSKLELGSPDNLDDKAGWEAFGMTSISFTIPLEASDPYSHSLKPGQLCHILLAYSLEDNFLHHSLRRTSLGIIL